MLLSSKNTEKSPVDGAYVDLPSLVQLRHQRQQQATSKRHSHAIRSGAHRSRALNRGMEFEEVRIYQPGDDVRTIDWRVTARTLTPHTKCYQEEKEKPVITLVDQRRSLFFGSQRWFKSVYACHIAARINWATLDRGDRAGGLVISAEGVQETRPTSSSRALSRWLQLLTTANNALSVDGTATEPSLFSALKQLKNTLQTGSECSIISDFYDLDKDCEQLLFLLSRHHFITLYWVLDPLEISLPPAGRISLSDGKNTAAFTVNQSLQQGFEKAYQAKKEQLESLARRYRLSLVQANTNEDPSPIIQRRNRS